MIIMEHEHQNFFFTIVVAILIVNSITLFGVLCILSDHEISRVSSGAGINSSPVATTYSPRPVRIPDDLHVASLSPLENSTTGNLATEFPSALFSDSTSATLTGSTIQDYPVLDDSVMPGMNSKGNGSRLPDAPLLPVQTSNSYVTLIYPDNDRPFSNDTLPEEIPNIEVPLLTVYELKNEDASKALPEIQYNLQNPPMIIRWDVADVNITRTKHIEYKRLSTEIEEDIIYERPSELGWFIVSVRNRDTGELVDEGGFGRQYGLQPESQITIRKTGNYSIMIDGFFVKINSFAINVNQQGAG